MQVNIKYLRHKNFLWIAFFLMVFMNLSAQKKITPAFAENETYKMYLNKNWKGLISVGKKALDYEYDYFYLRMRLGIAYYELQNYKIAQTHFSKALAFNSKNDLAKEYLYYCYLFTGKNEEARKLSNLFSPKLSKKLLHTKQSKIEFVNFEGAIKSTDKDYLDSNNKNHFESAKYLQIGLKHYVKKSYSLFHAATYFNQNTSLGEVKQLQYYLNATIPLKNNWAISPAFHLINTKFTGNSNNQFLSSNNNNIALSLSIKKNIEKIDLSLGTTFSNTGANDQINHFGTLSYAPFGNSKFVIGTTEYLHTSDNYENSTLAHAPFVYFKPTKLTSIKLSYLKNDTSNIIEDNGYLVNNSYDLTEQRVSTLIDLKISKRASVYGMYQHEKKLHTIDNFNYYYNLLLFGIKINH